MDWMRLQPSFHRSEHLKQRRKVGLNPIIPSLPALCGLHDDVLELVSEYSSWLPRVSIWKLELLLTLALVPVSRELGLKSTTMVGYSFRLRNPRDDANNIWKKKYIYILQCIHVISTVKNTCILYSHVPFFLFRQVSISHFWVLYIYIHSNI